MTPRIRFLLAGAALVVAALFGLLALVTAYWPFQSVVEVIAPFLALSIFSSVGLTLILIALMLPQGRSGASALNEQASALDSLLSELRR